MYKNVLANIPGIELYPIIALVLFFGFFVGLLFWFLRTDRNRLQLLAKDALEDGSTMSQPGLTADQRTSRV